MTRQHFRQQTLIPAPAQAVFDWHKRPEAFALLTPPWENVRVLESTGPIWQPGSRVVLRVGLVGPLALRWVAEHDGYVEGEQFCDRLVRGPWWEPSPFALWEHTHRVCPQGPDACLLDDEIVYALPFGPLGALLGGAMVRRKLQRLFAFRHQVTRDAFAAP